MKPIFTAHLFSDLHAALIRLLESLTPDQWQAPTVCKGWTVKDIASHMLDTQLRTLSMSRDTYFQPIPAQQPLINFLNSLNGTWVEATRRWSPQVLLELLRHSGPIHAAHIASLDPFATALFPVAWAGEDSSANWFHIGRDFTEYWHHQQQIRDAVGAAPLTSPHYLAPVLDLFVRAIPHAYREFEVTSLELEITGGAGGIWHFSSATGLHPGSAPQPSTRIRIEADQAWRLFTNGLKQPTLEAAGDPALIEHFLTVRAVMV